MCPPDSPPCALRLPPSPNRFPFYFELKIAFVIWLLSPYTKGSSVLYRKFVHPTLSNKEKVGPYSQPRTSLPSLGAQSLERPGRAPAFWSRHCLCPGVSQGRAGPLAQHQVLPPPPSPTPLRKSTSTSHRPETRVMRP